MSLDDLQKKGKLTIHRIFRAREVKQSYFTSIFTTLYALLHSFFLLARLSILDSLDLILTNGPGTALPLCYMSFVINKLLLFNIKSKLVYVESFCRVQELSLTGKLLRPILDKFVVQWEDLQKKYPMTQCFKQKIL